MADEPISGAGSGAGSGGGESGGSSSQGVGGTSMTEAQISAPGGDIAFLNAEPKGAESEVAKSTPAAEKDAPKAAEETAAEDVNLAALEEGQPEWLAKVTDEGAKTEVQKLLDLQKAFSEKFKDAADLDAFFKELPGGREQIAAMQTLSKEVGELDSAIEANTPEGNLGVAERYLSMAPDGGVGLLRAAAQHMAKANPEAWNQVSAELINSTLSEAGVGADFQAVLGAIAEMRTAVTADDGEAFGRAGGKLLGAPKTAAKTDPKLADAAARETAARTEAQKAQTETWTFRRDAGAAKIDTHARTEIGKRLAQVLPNTVSEKAKGELLNDIVQEVSSQVQSNAWLMSQVAELIGQRHPDGKGGFDHSKTNLRASQADFDKAQSLMIEAASPKLIVAAVSKIVSKWAKDRAASNADGRAKARGAAATVDVGAAKTAAAGSGRKAFTPEQMRARNERGDFVISDKDFLAS